MRDAGHVARAERDDVLFHAAEDDAVNVEQVAGDADADDLAIAGAVRLCARREAAMQQVAMVQALASADDHLATGEAALRSIPLSAGFLVPSTERLPATQLGDETVHLYATPPRLFPQILAGARFDNVTVATQKRRKCAGSVRSQPKTDGAATIVNAARTEVLLSCPHRVPGRCMAPPKRP